TTTTSSGPMVAFTTSRPSAALILVQRLDHLQPPSLLGRARRPSLHLLVPICHANEAAFGKGQIQQSGGGGEGGSEAYLFGQEERGDGPEFIDDQDRGVYALKLL